MDDKKKVNEGLELCLKGLCDICPYNGSDAPGGCKDELMYGAMISLKAQEPRVMAWHEVIGAALECRPVYIEVKDSEDKEPGDDRWAMVTQYKGSITNGMIRAMSSFITSEILLADRYGKTWRCWTSRPDQATREATPWN